MAGTLAFERPPVVVPPGDLAGAARMILRLVRRSDP
jgi:hypothetical protein